MMKNRFVLILMFCGAFFILPQLLYSQGIFESDKQSKPPSVFKNKTVFNSSPNTGNGNTFFPPPDPDTGGDGDPIDTPIGDGIVWLVLGLLIYVSIKVIRNRKKGFLLLKR